MITHTHTYQKCFWLIFFVLTICNTAFAIDVEYIVTIDNPSSGQAKIKMIVTNLSSESFSVQSIKHLPDEPRADVISIVAKDINNNILDIEPIPSEDPYKWTVSTPGLSRCIIEYTIKPKAYSAPWYPPNTEYYFCYISQDFVLAPAWAVFLIPVNGFWIKPDILKISLKVPQNWKKIVPWPFRDGYYYPLEIISPNWFDTFPATAFVLGNLDSYIKKIGNTEITVAFYGPWPENFIQNSVKNVRDIYSYYTSVWDNSLDYPYIVVFFPMSVNGDLVNGNESALDKLVEYNFNDPPNWKDFSADICESRWLTMDWGYLGGPFGWGWDKFGFSALYGHKSAAKLRLESLGWLNGNYSGDRDVYLQRIQEGTDLPLASKEAETDKELLWSKGSLVTVLLAREIYFRTNGTSTFDDLNKSLFIKYSGNIINEEELLSEINSLTGSDFQKFFNDYIYGTKLLPLDWIFEDNDGEGLSNLSELFWDTDPEKIDTDGDGYSDAVEVDEYSDPLDPTSIPGQFTDVPPGFWAEDYIYAIFNAGITTGCSKTPLKYCPQDDVTRTQMAAFLVRAVDEAEPPDNYCATGSPFSDVPFSHWACKYIKRLLELEITTGCGGGNYCSSDNVTRAQMAAFIVRAVDEAEPPDNYCATGSPFSDVPSSHWACKYIKPLSELEITTGCGGGKYCPSDYVTRAQMAAFLARAFLGM